MKSVEVVAAIIQHQERFLCVQRGPSELDYISKKFEFPGGKIEAGESPEVALTREIAEELSVTLEHLAFFTTVEHQYPDFHITMHCFLCSISNPDEIELTEHIDQKWLLKDALASLDWAAADIPIVSQLQSLVQET
ncbi:DNA mismatch repair protein MutT [Glaciecola punicea]|jgi:8-oxo-dGTP diphosphatase|uniref:(deoxy)nucleoside triphosphate pyrophosphohydrolase n=1 Tax=Glaciecola punicea TaxID=56804 RepID=UPI000872DA69|nr:(deoxy)nucleoside triphosphate pyrophosphohydrolase [Glaciecola punicea]OFA32040.1 DNA mismatch repair protein MutT [Glaciecola punicea]